MTFGKYMEGKDDSKVCDDVICSEEDNDSHDWLSGMNGKKSAQAGPLSHVELRPDPSPSLTLPIKGYGLKKWRRIQRDSGKVWDDGRVDADNEVIREKLNLGERSSKRFLEFYEGNKKSDTAVASMNSVVRSLEGGFDLLGNLALVKISSFAAGTYLENGEDCSSKSSNVAKVNNRRGGTSAVVEFPSDKSRARSLSGKNLIHPMLRDQQGKGSIAASTRFSADEVNIEKENSHSSVKSDPQSSNFVFMQGICSASNGIYDYNEDCEAGCENSSPGKAGADSSREVKDELNQNNTSSADMHPVVEPVNMLQSAKDMLVNEVLKLREMREGFLAYASEKVQETSSELFQPGEMSKFFITSQHEVLETEKRDSQSDIEDLFKKQMDANVQYLVISRYVQNIEAAALDQINILKEQKDLASKQTQLLHQLGDTERMVLVLNKEAIKLETFSEGMTRDDETLKMQKTICKHTSCFILQLLALIFALVVFIFQLSPKYDIVPT